MTALTTNNNTIKSDDVSFEDPSDASVQVFAGALVSLDSAGNARPARATNTDRVRGVAVEETDNSLGAIAAKNVKSRAGTYGFVNSAAGDEITKADFGSTCYVVDDQTVAKTSNSGARPAAGRIVRLEGLKVMVQIGEILGADGDLVASNDLSDVDDAATARANIGANVGFVTSERMPLDAAGVFYVSLPKAATIIDIRSVVAGTTTANGAATITCALDTTNITNGLLTIASGAVVGEQDTATPSAANVSTTEALRFTVAANSQDASAFATVTVEFTY